MIPGLKIKRILKGFDLLRTRLFLIGLNPLVRNQFSFITVLSHWIVSEELIQALNKNAAQWCCRVHGDFFYSYNEC
jgi:hypothetical protein